MALEPQPRRHTPGGYRDLWQISFPLILSTSSFSLLHVIDRIFLSWYSADALAASVPAGAAAWSVVSLFVGTASYITAFVSQYDGAGRKERIGAAVWQGIYFSLAATVILMFGGWLAEPLFNFAGHEPRVREQEIVFFEILVVGSGGAVLSSALSAFYSGRGKTWLIMWANLASALLTGLLDYLLIFGKWGFPEWGIWGAGVATIVAPWAMSLFYFSLLFLPGNRREFGTLRQWRFDRELFWRLLRFGVPSGLQWTVDITAFTLFVLLIGRIGSAELAASNIAFAINHLVFMPMIGLSMGTSVLVGRYLGANQPDISAKTTISAYWLTFAYMSAFSAVLFSFPGMFIRIFHPTDANVDFSQVEALGANLLYFVAAYSIVDSCNIVFTSALKGAGDTRFVLWIILIVATLFLVIPSYVACVLYGAGIYVAWVILTAYVAALSGCFYWRYRAGHWREMRVIEQHIPVAPDAIVEGPMLDT